MGTQSESIKAKENDLDKASARIKIFMAWQNYVLCKQLQELTVLQKKTNKYKTKEIVEEKFNAY